MQAGFGFYEDDYTLVVRAMATDWHGVRTFVGDVLLGFGGQGRPLQHSLVFLISYLAGQFGGPPAAYWLAYIIVAGNSLLFYLLVSKLAGRQLALVGGLTFALFAGDTTQTFLYHAFGLQPALTFLLLALLAHVSGKRVIGYAVISGALLSYETAFLVFLGAPLLDWDWRRDWRRLLGHALILSTMMGAVVALRLVVGEERVLGLTPTDLIRVSFLHSIQGPPVALGTYLLRPLQAFSQMHVQVVAAALLAFAVFSYVLRPKALSHPDLKSILPRLLAAGLAMLILAYPLTFTVRAYAVSGRDTRVHLAAAVGASLVLTSGWGLAYLRAGRPNLQLALRAGMAALLALMVGFGMRLQLDYVRAWDLQQRLWSSLLDWVPDLEQGDVVLLDPAGLEDSQYIDANTWNLPLVMQYVLLFPEDWREPPRVHRLLPDWQVRALTNPVELKAVDYRWQYVVVPWSRTVILQTASGRVTGRMAIVELEGQDYRLKQPGPGTSAFPKGFLYDALVEVQP